LKEISILIQLLNLIKGMNNKFTFIDLFSGIGGFHNAFSSLGGKCVFSSEINNDCKQVYELNYGIQPFGDITQIDPNLVPDHDILCAGFPCQPFSISGKQKGFEDTRGTLFFNIMKIVEIKKPSIIFLENVKQLRYHDRGNTLKVILEAIKNQGYLVEWRVLNSKDFGTPQNRERIIIIATKLKKFDFNKIAYSKEKIIKDIIDNEGKYEVLENNEYTILPKELWKRQKSGLIFVGYRNKDIRVKGTRPNTTHLSRVHKQPNRIYHVDGTHPTLPSQESSGRFWIYDDKIVRKLTLRECYNLMGYPKEFKNPCSNGTQYKQIGNSVVIPFIKAIGSEIINQFLFDKALNSNNLKINILEPYNQLF
jgi:DNA (cytosine-5)-methyltransferase 1